MRAYYCKDYIEHNMHTPNNSNDCGCDNNSITETLTVLMIGDLY